MSIVVRSHTRSGRMVKGYVRGSASAIKRFTRPGARPSTIRALKAANRFIGRGHQNVTALRQLRDHAKVDRALIQRELAAKVAVGRRRSKYR